MMMSARREPTLADVARVAGVSLTTVSRVLNNRGYLSQEVKDRVAEAITELNYRQPGRTSAARKVDAHDRRHRAHSRSALLR